MKNTCTNGISKTPTATIIMSRNFEPISNQNLKDIVICRHLMDTSIYGKSSYFPSALQTFHFNSALIAQMRPQPPDEYDMPNKIGSWGILAILGVSILVPWLLWRKAGGKEKELGGCAEIALTMSIVLVFGINFFLNIGFGGSLIFLGVCLAVWAIIKCFKK